MQSTDSSNSTPEAPFGYTKAGKIRKRAIPNNEGICPVKECKKSFRHRPDPKSAVWQHLLYYFRFKVHQGDGEIAKAHRAAHQEEKMKLASKNLSVEDRKEHKRQASHRFAERNPQKRKDAAALANFKAKARRHLRKQLRVGEEIDLKMVDEMANSWMEKRELAQANV